MIRLEDLRPMPLFNGVGDDQLAQLLATGTEVEIAPGVEVWQSGGPADAWWLLVEGAVTLVRRVGREDVVVGRMDVPGRWAGGFRAWDADSVYLATGIGLVAGRVLRVPAEALREWADLQFPFAAHLIEGLYRTARTVESTARQREALVTLGTLAAGLAHEINNPAAAATRAVHALDAACGTLVSTLGHLAAGELSTQQFAGLDALRREIVPRAAGLDPLAVADEEDAIASWADDHGVEDNWVIAAPLAAAGVDVAWCERAAEVLGEADLKPGLEWVASTFSVVTLLSEVKESTRRISELVRAVGSYSQLDMSSVQHINVTDGIESTLVMLSHKLKTGVRVVRRYDPDLPAIDAYAGELNQVWTNLIDNAVDAMGGEGTLEISARGDGDDVVVEIADSGAGMSPEVAARAFDAFYTTKDVGKGTGLGLDIARRIVNERHGGAISIRSQPGETVLGVRLPVRQSAR